MKTQTAHHGRSWKRAAVLALSAGALLVLSSCHHGVLGQPRRPHPHVAVHHRHAPDQFAAAYYGTRGKAPAVRHPRFHGRSFAHCHTTWGNLHRLPNYHHYLAF